MSRKEIIDILEHTNANDITPEECDKIIHLLKEMKEKTNFEKIYEFNNAFGVKTNNTPQKDLFDTDKKLVEYRLSLVNEEVQELNEAVANKDFVETIDALTDILYVVYGFYTSIGIDADKAFELVHSSNMSKLCISEQEAKDTVDSYKTDSRYDSPEYRLSDDDKHYVVFNKSTSKILKSINYSPVSFDSIL
jgi:predicted HAD superfamily Cof-like phosphohydrolase